MEVTINLDWKLIADLTPNKRLHWAVRARKSAVLKDIAFGLTLAQNPNGRFRYIDKATIDYHFYPFTKRGRDKDNFVSACKPAVDGMAQALGLNDSILDLGDVQFLPWPGASRAGKAGRGFVELTIRAEATW